MSTNEKIPLEQAQGAIDEFGRAAEQFIEELQHRITALFQEEFGEFNEQKNEEVGAAMRRWREDSVAEVRKQLEKSATNLERLAT